MLHTSEQLFWKTKSLKIKGLKVKEDGRRAKGRIVGVITLKEATRRKYHSYLPYEGHNLRPRSVEMESLN